MSVPSRSRSNVPLVIVGSVLLLALAFWAISSASGTDADEVTSTQARVHKAFAPHPLAVACRDLLARSEERLAVLYAKVDGARSPEESLALEREVQRVKLETEREVLRIQLEHAQATGNETSAIQLRESIDSIQRLVDRLPVPAVPESQTR